MQRIPRIFIIGFLLVGLLALAGCNLDYKQLMQKSEPPEPELLKVEIYFTDKDHIPAYVKSLGIEKDGQVYTGGSSLNYLYDANGKIIGSFNYAKVEYIKIVK